MLVNFDPKLLNDKILNLDKIMALNESDRKSIFDLFERLTQCFNGKSGIPIVYPAAIDTRFDLITAQMIYNSLLEYGYLVTKREKRLDDVLE